MSDQQPTTPNRRARPKLEDAFRTTTPIVQDIVSHARPVSGTPRQLAIAALLGVCLVFLAAFVAVPRLDTTLQLALWAFVAGIVLLSMATVLAAFRFAPVSRLGKLWARSLNAGSQIVCEVGGSVAVFIGVLFVVWHLNGWAVLFGGAILIVALIVAVPAGNVYAGRHPDTTGSPPANEASQQ
jgi:cation transport ATPase